VAFAVVASVALAIILWDYVTLLPDEIRLYRKPVWRTLPPYGFLGLRYGGILATLPVIFLSVTTSSNCQTAVSLSQAGVVLVVSSSAMVLTFRTFLLWSDSGAVGGILSGLWIITTGCWIALATQYRAVAGPHPSFGSNCRVLPTVSWLPLGNTSFTIFLLTALILTLLKMKSHRRQDSLVAHLIYRANLLYLSGTAITTITALVIQIVSPPSTALALSTGPIATALTVAFGTRVFRNLMLAGAMETERAHGLPYSYP
ncbi:hypothetical protein B0H19DRAFT_844641, partial [Mycena capillaripes]